MENEFPRLTGKVECDHIGRSRALRKLVENSLARWILSASSSGGSAVEARYRAIFRRSGQGHTVVCHVEVSRGDQTWVGLGFENGIYAALKQSIEHLVLFEESSLSPAAS